MNKDAGDRALTPNKTIAHWYSRQPPCYTKTLFQGFGCCFFLFWSLTNEWWKVRRGACQFCSHTNTWEDSLPPGEMTQGEVITECIYIHSLKRRSAGKAPSNLVHRRVHSRSWCMARVKNIWIEHSNYPTISTKDSLDPVHACGLEFCLYSHSSQWSSTIQTQDFSHNVIVHEYKYWRARGKILKTLRTKSSCESQGKKETCFHSTRSTLISCCAKKIIKPCLRCHCESYI